MMRILSVVEALDHAGIATGTKVNIRWIDSEELDDTSVDPKEVFEGVEGIIVPGGFGSRGVEGKIRTIQYARENNIPYLGLCLGMQSAVMEFARNVCGMEGATSSEFDENAKYKVIDLMSDQVDVDKKRRYDAFRYLSMQSGSRYENSRGLWRRFDL